MKQQIAIAIYKAKPQSRDSLLSLLGEHESTLRRENLLSERPRMLMEAGEDFFLEVLEWKSAEAASKAHENPAVIEVWGKLEKVAAFRALNDLPEETRKYPFPKFQAIVPPAAESRSATYSDNMLAAKDFKRLVAFYSATFGLSAKSHSDCHSFLVDPVSQQKLCITDGESVGRMSPGIESTNLERTLADIEAAGGKTLQRWEFKSMFGANCSDPEGNELMVWQLK